MAQIHADEIRKTTASEIPTHCYENENQVFVQKTDGTSMGSSGEIAHNHSKYNNVLLFGPVAASGEQTVPNITSRKDPSRRATTALKKRQCQQLTESWLFAQSQNMPLNRGITISVELLDLPERFDTFRSGLFGYLQKWQRDRYGKPAYIWVVEYGKTLGLHLHVAAYTDDAVLLSRDLQRWIKAQAGIRGNMPAKAFKSQPATFGWLPYVLKGADPEAVRYLLRTFRFPIRPEPQGYVTGKRYGISRSIAQKARNGAKFDAVKELSGLLRGVGRKYPSLP
ncbi:hypothetical protein [Thalassospira lucentensis]|uniref:hypothetical protein n=1 Tax=Thalassospira lucentensis TaxID=168935 RepID=UPI003D2A4D7F